MNRFEALKLGASLALALALSSCSALRPAASSKAAPLPPPAAAEQSTPAPAVSGVPENGNENSQPSIADSVIPPCLPPEARPRPKPKPRLKPVRKEAPPQPPSAPAAETQSNGIVDAQVRPMPVPVMSILGKRVRSPTGEDLGRVVDVLADAGGRVRIAIVDFGGFLGVGNRRIAVDWPLLRFNPDAHDQSLLLSLSHEKLQAAPEYKDNVRPQTLMDPAAPESTAAPAPSPSPPAPTPADNKK